MIAGTQSNSGPPKTVEWLSRMCWRRVVPLRGAPPTKTSRSPAVPRVAGPPIRWWSIRATLSRTARKSGGGLVRGPGAVFGPPPSVSTGQRLQLHRESRPIRISSLLLKRSRRPFQGGPPFLVELLDRLAGEHFPDFLLVLALAHCRV